jgi:multiple sugar transport system ATP-binding protein
MAGIAVQEVRKTFGQTTVLDRVTLDIAAGEFFSLIGPSGCGKTTLLRIIAGLEQQDSGSICIGGQSIDAQPPKQRNLAMVFQSYALYPYMTVGENVALPLVMRRLNTLQRLPLLGPLMPGAGRKRRQIDAEVAAVTSSLAIGHLHNRRPAQLSGGQRQRVALARAMVRQPQAFLMDEPLSNLDAKMRVQARTEIAELHRRLGTTFVYVTHDQSEAMTMSDRIAVMMGGRLLQIAAPQTIYDQPATIEVARFIGTPQINVLPAKVRRDGALEVLGQCWPLTAPGQSGEDLQVGIRPEAWTLHPSGLPKRPPYVDGTVRHLELLGSETLVHVEINDHAHLVIARVDPVAGVGLRLGMPVCLDVAGGRVLIFDMQGRRVGDDTAVPLAPLAKAAHV